MAQFACCHDWSEHTVNVAHYTCMSTAKGGDQKKKHNERLNMSDSGVFRIIIWCVEWWRGESCMWLLSLQHRKVLPHKTCHCFFFCNRMFGCNLLRVGGREDILMLLIYIFLSYASASSSICALFCVGSPLILLLLPPEFTSHVIYVLLLPNFSVPSIYTWL